MPLSAGAAGDAAIEQLSPRCTLAGVVAQASSIVQGRNNKKYKYMNDSGSTLNSSFT